MEFFDHFLYVEANSKAKSKASSPAPREAAFDCSAAAAQPGGWTLSSPLLARRSHRVDELPLPPPAVRDPAFATQTVAGLHHARTQLSPRGRDPRKPAAHQWPSSAFRLCRLIPPGAGGRDDMWGPHDGGSHYFSV
ncbi:hypothetical protein [Oryza sativa Japonica Group]|uniref:Uncharacterized protein n=1 Tax=Oryza sativa subsp. japonica TaxID=39947 RepID=Q5JKP4_ORYSJ|nr:hypothetical protein [Oryza sativa Japonica Group]